MVNQAMQKEGDMQMAYFPQIYKIFSAMCFQTFYKKLLENEEFGADGQWIAQIIELLCGMMSKFALLSDSYEKDKPDDS